MGEAAHHHPSWWLFKKSIIIISALLLIFSVSHTLLREKWRCQSYFSSSLSLCHPCMMMACASFINGLRIDSSGSVLSWSRQDRRRLRPPLIHQQQHNGPTSLTFFVEKKWYYRERVVFMSTSCRYWPYHYDDDDDDDVWNNILEGPFLSFVVVVFFSFEPEEYNNNNVSLSRQKNKEPVIVCVYRITHLTRAQREREGKFRVICCLPAYLVVVVLYKTCNRRIVQQLPERKTRPVSYLVK